MATSTKVISDIKAGFKTTEFYLSSFVTLVGSIVQFLPAGVAGPTVKVSALVAAVLSALGYTASRAIVKTGSNS